GLLVVLIWAHSAFAEPSCCDAVVDEGSKFTVCEAELRRHVVKLFWGRAEGEPYGYLSSLAPSLGGHAGRLLFATIAGMYHPDYRPVGLYIENGKQLVRANTKAGPGNFHMKPNGIFYVTKDAVGILETSA